MTMFTWNGDYDDREQVRPYLADYAALRDAGVCYNVDFKGRIPGIADCPDEDRAIYMLSCLWRIEGEHAEVNAAVRDGYTVVSTGVATQQRYGEVIVYRPGFYSGGTGKISRYSDVRLCFNAEGQPAVLLPKGSRTRGWDVRGAQILTRNRRTP